MTLDDVKTLVEWKLYAVFSFLCLPCFLNQPTRHAPPRLALTSPESRALAGGS
jgi:hypothetical protein